MTDLLPPNATKQERELSNSVARIASVPLPIRDLWNIEACPVELLPWLAWAFAVDAWRSLKSDSNPDGWTEDYQRTVISASLEMHRHKGTVGSVTQLVNALKIGAITQEWWEQTVPMQSQDGKQLVSSTGKSLVVPTGDPYTATITIADTEVPATVQADLIAAIERVKPVRTLIIVQNVNGFKGGVNICGGAYITVFTRLEATANYMPDPVDSLIDQNGDRLTTNTGSIISL